MNTDRQNLDIRKPSFVGRWLREFLTERHSFAARAVLLAIAIAFFLDGPNIVITLAQFLPVSELGSSGASIWAHGLLKCFAAVLFGGIAYAALKPALAGIELSEEGIRLNSIAGFFPLKGTLLSWDKINMISIERPAQITDMRSFLLALNCSEDPKLSVKIPLGNLSNEENRQTLLDLLQNRARHAIIEPGALEAIKPAKNLSFTDIWLDALSAAPGRERLSPLADGSKLKDRFEIVKRLGGGGQATAYLASDTQNKNQVVLKETILPVYADLPTRKQSLSKFHEEAIALESVKHVQIVSYLDSFVEDHRAYLVLQYIDGITLKKHIEKNGALSAKAALELALQMCEILNALHSLQPPLIHRDFTPDNLMLDPEGKLVLIDFAVATSDDTNEESAGKIAYMAPEQFKGTSSVQTDIYSLGCTLYYVLCAQDPEPLSAALPSKVLNSISAEIDTVVSTATSQGTEARYRNVNQLKTALDELQLL